MMLLAVLLGLPLQLHAQTPADTLATLLKQARRQHWIVRATLSSGAQHEGAATTTPDSGFAIDGSAIELTAVTALERKRVNHATTSVGAILGGIGGLVLGIGLASWVCSSEEDGCADSAILAGGALTSAGVALGGIIGGSLGPPEWRMLWRRP